MLTQQARQYGASDGTSKYLSFADYMRESTLAGLDDLSNEDLDAESPEHFRSFCPTVGHMFILIGTHPMMHAGQFVPVRRKLGKPVLL